MIIPKQFMLVELKIKLLILPIGKIYTMVLFCLWDRNQNRLYFISVTEFVVKSRTIQSLSTVHIYNFFYISTVGYHLFLSI